MAMTCQHLRKMLNAFLDNELTVSELKMVKAHLSSCRDCREVVTRHNTLGAMIGEVRIPNFPEGLSGQIMAAAHGQLAKRLFPGLSALRWWIAEPWLVRAASLATIVAGFILGALMGSNLWGETQPTESLNLNTPDPVAIYNLDYFSGAPVGSFERAYLGLPSTAREKR